MTKRAHKKFDRVERDFYPTPLKAVLPLLPHLEPGTRFIEPCAGNYALAGHLEASGHVCVHADDISPQHPRVGWRDAFDPYSSDDLVGVDCFITNPPWDRKILHPLIHHLVQYKPAWLLFDADWAFTKQAKQFSQYCTKIVVVGRVKWIEDSDHVGFDNAAFYRFERRRGDCDATTGSGRGPEFIFAR